MTDDEGECELRVAVLGQPSTGKSTFFTHVTGKVERVASWPGTTVERKVARVVHRGTKLCFIDLPGIYGLSTASPEEELTKKFLLRESYDVVLALMDPLVIERSIYLPIQLAEMGVKVVVAVTKWDIVHKSGLHVDVGRISSRLGVPVVPISSVTGEGVESLLAVIMDTAKRARVGVSSLPNYGPLNMYIEKVASRIENLRNPSLSIHWVALRLLEGDDDVAELVSDPEVLKLVKQLREEFKRVHGVYPEDFAVYVRYRKASEVLDGAVVRISIKESGLSALLDRLYTTPKFGTAASLTTLFLIFLAAFTVNTGFPLNVAMRFSGLESAAEALEEYSLTGLLRLAFSSMGSVVKNFLSSYSEALAAIVADGLIVSVGQVLSFAPLILVVSALISVLEDSGLGPRMVHSLHKSLSYFGLSGRSLYPLVVGLGCNVPAVMLSRTSVDRHERLQVIGSASFIVCQARLVVMMYFSQLVFPGQVLLQSALMLILYLTSILLYLISSKILRTLVFKVRESPELVMEIPPLHRPSTRVVWWNSWIRVRHFIVKAGTIIFVMSLASWVMVSYGPLGPAGGPGESYAAVIGSAVGKFMELAYGIDQSTSWKVGYAVLYGAVAKEGLVTSVATLSAAEESEALEVLGLSIPQAIGLLFFFMFYIPCLPTIGVIYTESRSIKFTIGVSSYLVLVSLALSVSIYRLLDFLAY